MVCALAHDADNPVVCEIGCKIDTLNATELTKLGIPASSAGEKRAILKAPLVFPKPRTGKRRT